MPILHGQGTKFEIGKAIHLTSRKTRYEVVILAIGETLAPAYRAAQRLSSEGLAIGLLSIHSLRPFDESAILEAASRSKGVITIEEHSVHGGLGQHDSVIINAK